MRVLAPLPLITSGYGNDGTITGAAWVTGQLGGALSLDGVDDYVTVPPEAWSSIDKQVTIALWTYGDPEKQPQKGCGFSAIHGTDWGRVVHVILTYPNENVYFDTGGAATATGVSDIDRINKKASPEEYKGSWQHWTFTKNADTGEMKIYLNGVLWHSGSGKTRTMEGTKVE